MNQNTRPLPNDHHGAFSNKRMQLLPPLPIPVSYASAAVPRYAPFGTEYTPGHSVKIIGSRLIEVPDSVSNATSYKTDLSATNYDDPDIAPTKAIQNVHARDNSGWQQQSKGRFDTTYRSEYINRIRHPEYVPWYQQLSSNEIAKPIRDTRSSLSQYSVLPPISSAKNFSNNGHPDNRAPPVTTRTDRTQMPFKDQEVPSNEIKPREMPPPSLPNDNQYFYEQQQQQQQQQPMMIGTVDTYLPEEPVLLTDYEEQRLCEQIRTQLAYAGAVDRLKLFYQELVKYDPNVTNYVHYTAIQTLVSQLGLNLGEDTLRFAMCKFVSPERARGYVNYEDLVRYFGKCLSAIYPNSYGQPRELSPRKYDFDNGFYNRAASTQVQYPPAMSVQSSLEHEPEDFDPDERQVRVLLKQNLKNFDVNGSIDFDKLHREFKLADRNHTGVLNRQQIEEVIYKVRIPIQRSLIFQILEKHCRAYLRLYRWEAFLQYLKEQIFDIREVQDRSSPVYTQYTPTRNEWLDYMRRAYNENERIRIIQRYNTRTEGPRLESNHPSAWFTRFLRLANAMYSYRINSNRQQEFLLPREEARRLLRAYIQIWDLRIDDDKLQRVLDASARNGDTNIDDALQLLAQ